MNEESGEGFMKKEVLKPDLKDLQLLTEMIRVTKAG